MEVALQFVGMGYVALMRIVRAVQRIAGNVLRYVEMVFVNPKKIV